jgi:hypothetical protein
MNPCRKSIAAICAAVLCLVGMTCGFARADARRGCDLAVYWDNLYGGEVWRTADDQPSPPTRWTKQISSIIVIAGIWDFYWDGNYKGEVITFPPGAYPYVGDHWNDKISSFRCVRPTP